MIELLWPFTYWHWLALGLLLLAGEALLPGFILMWFGVGAIATGMALWASAEMVWQWQLVIFAVISVAATLLWRLRLKNHPTESEQPGLNERGAQYVGRVVIAPEGISNGSGRVVVGDSSWRAAGPDCPAGTAVRILRVDGATLVVQPAGD